MFGEHRRVRSMDAASYSSAFSQSPCITPFPVEMFLIFFHVFQVSVFDDTINKDVETADSEHDKSDTRKDQKHHVSFEPLYSVRGVWKTRCALGADDRNQGGGH